MDKALSNKVSFIQAVSCIMVVLIHATTFVFKLPEGKINVYGKNLTTYLQLLLSEGICRVAVPLFFFISGLLFFKGYTLSKNAIWKKYKKKMKVYLIPYLFWSILVYLAFVAITQTPNLSQFVTTRNILPITFRSALNNIVISPINSPLWFLRNLLVFTIFHPIIWMVLKSKRIGLVFVIISSGLWLFLPQCPFATYAGLFFFSCGAYFGIHRLELLKKKSEFRGLALAIGWLTSCFLIATYEMTLNVSYLESGLGVTYAFAVLKKASVLLGCVALWEVLDFIPEINRVLKVLKKYSFPIFVMHHPIVTLIKKIFIRLLSQYEFAALLTYFLSASATIALIIFFCYVFSKAIPKMYATIMGSRG